MSPTLRAILSLLLVSVAAEVGAAPGPESAADIPFVDLDEFALRDPAVPTRARWLFRPSDPAAAELRLGTAGASRVAVLTVLADTWVLEAPFDSVARVETVFGEVGSLEADARGVPALLQSTAAVGVRPRVWTGLDLRGDGSGSLAILDSGVDTAHDDLGDLDQDNLGAYGGDADDWADGAAGLRAESALRVIAWHDVSDDLPGSVGPWDAHFHGTALASAAIGSGRLDANATGVAPRAPLVVVKTWNFEERWEIWASDLILGVEWVLANASTYRIRAVLVGANWDREVSMGAAIEALVDRGIVVIAPAGNDPDGPLGWPARIPSVLTVGSCLVDGSLANYSTPAPAGAGEPLVDLLAPGGAGADGGDRIRVADNEPDDAYRERWGTSLSAAHVAGAVSLVSEALTESGRRWRSERGQVEWLVDLLRATAAPTEGVEPPRASVPFPPRVGWNRHEGHGVLRVDAAVDAAARVAWPGEPVSFELGSIVDAAPVGAVRVPWVDGRPLRLELLPPADADFDLVAYEDRGDRLRLLGWSARAGVGVPEQFTVEGVTSGWVVVVVRRVSGEGLATLATVGSFLGESGWPVEVSRSFAAPPVVEDLDGDGRREVIAVANIGGDDSHRLHVWTAEGRALAGFPVFLDAPGSGQLSAPAVARGNNGPVVSAGSDYGVAFGVQVGTGAKWARVLSSSGRTSAPCVVDVGGGDALFFGVATGLVRVGVEDGAIATTIPLGARVSLPPAVGDLDRDGAEEIVVVDELRRVHALEVGGAALPGWPRTLAGTPTAPVLLGDEDGLGPRRVLLGELRFDGSAWLHRLGPDGTAEGAPWPIAAGRSVQGISPLAVSALGRGAPLEVVVVSVSLDGAGRLLQSVHRIDPTSGTESTVDEVLAQRIFAGGFLLAPGPVVMEPRTLEFTGTAGVEVLARTRVAWNEFGAVARARYGSREALQFHGGAGIDPRGRLAIDGGHLTQMPTTSVPPVVSDLDGDGRSEVLVPRGNRLHLLQARTRGAGDRAWGLDRGDARRRACAGCEALPTVDAPPAGTRRLVVAPNPLNPRTELRLAGAAGERVEFELFDLRGRSLASWTSEVVDDDHRETLRPEDRVGRELSSGVYLLRARSGHATSTARLVLVR